MALQLNASSITKFNNFIAIQDLANIKRLLCLLKKSVTTDLANSLTSPSSTTAAAADLFFMTIIASNYVGLALNNQTFASNQVVTSSSNVTTYGIINNYSNSIAGEALVYTYTGLVNTNLSLALLLSTTNLTIYANTNVPSVMTVLTTLENHYTTVISFLKRDISKKHVVPDYFLGDLLDVNSSMILSENDVLAYSDCQWTNLGLFLNSGIIKDTSVNTSSLSDGSLLRWNSASQRWINSQPDIQQTVSSFTSGPISETLVLPNVYYPIDLANYPVNGFFNLTSTQTGQYNVNWTGVINSVATLGVSMRITAIDPSNTIDITELETNTETYLNLTANINESLSINYLVNNVSPLTIFIVQWSIDTLSALPVNIVSGNLVIHKLS